MKEEVVVGIIEKQLKANGRYYDNMHGSIYSQNGTPDFVTLDDKNRYLGIEAKAPGKSPYTNQWRRAIEILLAGGRYVIAQEDFDFDNIRKNSLPKIEIGRIVGESEFEMLGYQVKCTSEVILKEDKKKKS